MTTDENPATIAMKRSKATTNRNDGWEQFAGMGIPEVTEAIERIKVKEQQGIFKSPPRSTKDIHCLEELCRYVFAKVDLDGSYQVEFSGDCIRTWVWRGKDFHSRVAVTVARIAPRLSDRDSLEELRLVATDVDEKRTQLLQEAFPSAKIVVISDEEDAANWRWSQAH